MLSDFKRLRVKDVILEENAKGMIFKIEIIPNDEKKLDELVDYYTIFNVWKLNFSSFYKTVEQKNSIKSFLVDFIGTEKKENSLLGLEELVSKFSNYLKKNKFYCYGLIKTRVYKERNIEVVDLILNEQQYQEKMQNYQTLKKISF